MLTFISAERALRDPAAAIRVHIPRRDLNNGEQGCDTKWDQTYLYCPCRGA